ncbi:MAG: glycosyltransferase [Lachnospiraceae bacterium]|nr:glycosyltransferase [Lachnospiraceae bacterium]
MSDKPMISVIMSTYNEEERFLREAIESILNQTYSDFEFLIGVDKPDNQALIDILNEYALRDLRVSVHVNEKNLGLAMTLNKLIDLAKGDYIARMDADDKSDPERLEHQLKYMQDNDLDIISCDVNVIDEDDNIIQKMYNLPSVDGQIRKKLKINNCMPHPGWMVRRELYEAIGGYEATPYCEDYEFLLKVRGGDFKFGNLNEPLLNYRMTSISISRANLYKQYLSMKYCQTKYVSGQAVEFDSYINSHYDAAEEIRYNKSAANFTSGLAVLKELKLIRAFVLLCKAFFGSKCYRDKMWKYLQQVL